MPAGSGRSQSRYRVPGTTGQASPHPIVITTSTSRTSSSRRPFGRAAETSSPRSAIASTTFGWISSDGAVPADRTRTRPPAWCSSSATAIWLRPALCTQTNRTSGTSFGWGIAVIRSESARPDDRRVHAVRDVVSGLDLDLAEPRTLQTRAALVERQRAGDASDEAPSLGPRRGREVIGRHDVADPDPAARLEHATHLLEHRELVCGQVDHAVRDDHVDARVRQRDVLDVALEELDVLGARVGCVAPGEIEHLVGHVEPVRVAGRPDPSRREQHVDPAARTQVEHGLALAQLGDGSGIPAPEARQDRGVGELGPLHRVVQLGAPDLVLRAAASRIATPVAAVPHVDRDLAVVLADLLPDLAHEIAPSSSKILPRRGSTSRFTV